LFYISAAERIGVHLQQLLRNPSESYRIQCNYADVRAITRVQGHSRSPILVPIESSYASAARINVGDGQNSKYVNSMFFIFSLHQVG